MDSERAGQEQLDSYGRGLFAAVNIDRLMVMIFICLWFYSFDVVQKSHAFASRQGFNKM